MRDLTGSMRSLDMSGDTAQAYRTCQVDLNNTRDGRHYAVPFKNGGEVRVLYFGREVFRGILFERGINTDGSQSLTAHDYNVYLTKNSDTVRFIKKSATQIIAELCGKFGIKVGKLANTKHVIPKLILRGKTIYEIIVTALTMTQKATGKRYRLRSIAGKLELVEVVEQIKRLVLENGRNIMGASFSESIEDVRTKVKMTGGDENKPVTVEVSSPRAKDFGIMQHYEHNSDVKTVAKLKPLANALLAELSKPKQEFSVTAYGDIDVVSATAVAVSEAMTDIKGVFYVGSDSHKIDENGLHVMSLKLTRELELEQIEYDPPAEPKPKKAKAEKKKKDDKEDAKGAKK